MTRGALAANAVTATGVVAGMAALFAGATGQVLLMLHLLLAVACLDALDGYVARRFDGVTRFGRYADSVSDFIAFGLGGALLAFAQAGDPFWGGALALIWVACAGWRLWHFAHAGEHGAFAGLPSSAAALALFVPAIIGWQLVGMVAVPILAALMLSPLRFTRDLKLIAGAAVVGVVVALVLRASPGEALPLAAGFAALAYMAASLGLRR